MNNPKEFYKAQIALHTISLKKAKKRLAVSGVIRLSVFLAIVTGIYFAYPNAQIVVGSIVLGIIIFIYLVNRHSNLTYSKNLLEKLIDMNRLELDILHPNSFDKHPLNKLSSRKKIYG